MSKALNIRPQYIIDKLGRNSTICLLNSKDILRVLKDEKVIFMACNPRIRHPIPGIMKAAEELDAIIGFELAKTEGGVDGGYTGQTPEILFNTIIEYANEYNFSKPFFIHADHITVKSSEDKDIKSAAQLIEAELKAGYTSFAIDASFNELEDNIRITTELAKPIIEQNMGLEVEVGEIKSTGQEAEITTVEEAYTFISSLNKNGIAPNLLAINNGSKHGNYKPDEKVHIDLQRTGEIYEAIKSFNINIAQHGITGTPLDLIGQFADYGIRKGNVATIWQNIAHEHLPEDLMETMKNWTKENNEDIKRATKVFKKEIDSIPQKNIDETIEHVYHSALDFIKAFRAVGTASMFENRL